MCKTGISTLSLRITEHPYWIKLRYVQLMHTCVQIYCGKYHFKQFNNKWVILKKCALLTGSLEVSFSIFIIPHVNSPYKTSIAERLIFYNITRCYSDSECCHVFVMAAGDIINYQGGHMMRNTDVCMVCSRQETFNSNGGHDAWFGHFKLQITSLFIFIYKHKVWVLVFLVRTKGTHWDQI